VLKTFVLFIGDYRRRFWTRKRWCKKRANSVSTSFYEITCATTCSSTVGRWDCVPVVACYDMCIPTLHLTA